MNKLAGQRHGGFTLVETLVAGMILALSASVLGLTVRGGMQSLAMSRDYQRAAELLDRVMTKIDTIGPSRLSVEGPLADVFAPPHDRFWWSAVIAPRLEGSLYDVTVRITWRTPGGGQRHVEAQTFLNDPPGRRQSRLGWDDL